MAVTHPPLPLGVTRLDLGELVLAFLENKVVFSPKGSRSHYTLHAGRHSKVLDVHKTTDHADGRREQVRLFSMPHAQLHAMMEALAHPFTEILMGLARPLSLRWIEKWRVRAIVGLLPTDVDLAKVCRVRRHRLFIEPRKIAARAWAPASLDELYDLEDGKIFTLISYPRNKRARKIGYGFPVTDARRRRHLVWIPDDAVTQAMQRGSAILEEAATKYGTFHAPQDPNARPADSFI